MRKNHSRMESVQKRDHDPPRKVRLLGVGKKQCSIRCSPVGIPRDRKVEVTVAIAVGLPLSRPSHLARDEASLSREINDKYVQRRRKTYQRLSRKNQNYALIELNQTMTVPP
jgi:hypothetical protein